MNFASKFVHVSRQAENEVDIDEDEVNAQDEDAEEFLADAAAPSAPAPAPAAGGGFGGFFGSLLGNISASPVSSQSQGVAPPPPVAQARGRRRMDKEKKPKANRKVYRQQVDTNVVSISLGTLGVKAEQVMATGDPYFCKNERCAAALNLISKIDRVGDKKLWNCEFCGLLNDLDIEEEEIPKPKEESKVEDAGASLEYLLEPAPVAAADDIKSEQDGNGAYVVFCIDTSGSMCVSQEVQGGFRLKNTKKFEDEFSGLLQEGDEGYQPVNANQKKSTYVSRLQAVQAAVDAQLEALAKSQPSKRVILVTFNNEVTIIGNGISQPLVVAGGKLHNEEKLKEIGSAYDATETIGATKDALSEKLYKLETSGQTGLGPALLISLAIAGKKAGSKVIVCTDGLANIGPGSLEGLDISSARLAIDQWYENCGNSALASGVSVDVISITSDNCNLELLGKVSDISGGSVDRVNPLDLKNNFAKALEKPLIASLVEATMLIHSGLRFRDQLVNVMQVDGNAQQEQKEEALIGRTISKKTQVVGNVFGDTEIFFEYSLASDDMYEKFKGLKALPFQVLIRYTRLDGSKWIRILTQQKPITADRSKAECDIDVGILASNAAVRGAELAQMGKYEEFRAHQQAWRGYVGKQAHGVKSAQIASDYADVSSALERNIKQAQVMEAQDNLQMVDQSEQARKDYRSANRNDAVSASLFKAKKTNFK